MNRITGIAAATMMALTLGVAAAQGADINGEVKKIDEGAGKITLKHGPAKSLGMEEPMTMVYRSGAAQAAQGRRQGQIRRSGG